MRSTGIALAIVAMLFAAMLGMACCTPGRSPALAEEAPDGPGVTVTAPDLQSGEEGATPGEGQENTAMAGRSGRDEGERREPFEGEGPTAPQTQGALLDAEQPTEPGIAASFSSETNVLSIQLSDPQGATTLRVRLGRGLKPCPGIPFSGDAVKGVSGAVDEEGPHIDISLGEGTTAAVATFGIPLDGIAARSIELLDEEGDVLSSIGSIPAPPGMALEPAELASGESAPFTTVGHYANTATATLNSIPRIANANDGTPAYCNDMLLNAPGDPNHGPSDPVWYDRWFFPNDPQAAADQGKNLLDYLMFHGYPSDPTIGGACSDPQDAEAATQWAIWSFTNPGSHPTTEAPSESWSAGFWQAYDGLIAGAWAYDAAVRADPGAFRPERDACIVWETGADELQNILTARPAYGWLDVAKASTRPDLIDGRAYSLADGVFEVRTSNGSVAATLQTDDSGQASCLLPVGSYVLVETDAPAGHALDPTPRNVTITGGPVHVRLDVSDPAIMGDIRISKHGGTPSGPPVPTARFSIEDAASGAEVMELETDANGQASTGDEALPLGTYLIHEISAPDGFGIADEIQLTLDETTAQKEVTIVDPYMTHVSISKTSAKTGEALAGARLQVINENGTVVDDWVSASKPHEMTGLAPGSYTLREVEAPQGYKLAPDVPFEIRLTASEQDVTMVDERSCVPFSFAKIDAISRIPLEGALFALYQPTRELPDTIGQQEIRDDSLWELVDAQASDVNGLVDFGELDEGTYLLLEERVPHGYVRPSGGWVVGVDSEQGLSLESVGDVSNPPFEHDQGTLRVGNYRQSELPRTGGTGSIAPLITGATLAATGVALAARGRRAARKVARSVASAALMALALCALIVPALAIAQPSELPDPDHAASLSVHKYVLPDEVAPGEPSDGRPIEQESLPDDAQPIQGVTFAIRRAYSRGEADALISQGTARAEDFSPAPGATGEFADYVVRAGDEELSAETNAEGVARFDLPGHQGTWLVRELPDPRVEAGCAPFLASVPMADPQDEASWLYDVHVYPKNYRIDVDKAIIERGECTMQASAAIGEAVTFRIACDVPNNIDRATSYVVTDQLDWRISTTPAMPEGLAVTAGDMELQPGKDFTVSVSPATDDAGHACQLLSWDFTPGLTRLKGAVDAAQGPGEAKVVIDFVARPNEGAVSGTLDNGARLEIVNEAGTHHEFETQRPTVSFGAINVDKCQADDPSLKLEGAVFRIAASIEDAHAGRWMHRLAPDGSDAGIWEERTAGDGSATFGGLRYDLQNGTDYYLVEVQSPTGFQPVSEPIRVHVGPAGNPDEPELSPTIQVRDAPVPVLPNTGGRGSASCVVGGALLVAAGLGLPLATRSRRRHAHRSRR
ncbi:MAG: SpaH/EbpB family LPXTG-anchored major pilin [Coriobacteriia bacterium]|nr:SpaH/EbpB family LPXTG-anchored major pilin [Coriobacteriia bacterium]